MVEGLQSEHGQWCTVSRISKEIDLFEHGCLHDCIRVYTVAEVHLITGTAGEYTLVSYVRKMVAS